MVFGSDVYMQTTESGCCRHSLSLVLGFLTAVVLSVNSQVCSEAQEDCGTDGLLGAC